MNKCFLVPKWTGLWLQKMSYSEEKRQPVLKFDANFKSYVLSMYYLCNIYVLSISMCFIVVQRPLPDTWQQSFLTCSLPSQHKNMKKFAEIKTSDKTCDVIKLAELRQRRYKISDVALTYNVWNCRTETKCLLGRKLNDS